MMMNEPWLILDSNYLCHRAYHSTGGLEYGDIKTGVLFGFLRDVVILQDLFATDRPLFCFDMPPGLREGVCKTYKADRVARYNAMPEEEREAYIAFREQVTLLRERVLPRCGYRNIFYEPGYESDDIIASLCRSLPQTDEVVIISSDKDLYQLLSPRVRCHNPQKRQTFTEHEFRATYGIDPDQWPDVKALAGCPSDNVVGIRGVGELTAIQYLRGELKAPGKKYKDIECNAGQATWRRNLCLVTLPYHGCPTFEVRPDDVTVARWRRVADWLGLKSLRDEALITQRAARRALSDVEELAGL
jgi:5'-3' exonuclease